MKTNPDHMDFTPEWYEAAQYADTEPEPLKELYDTNEDTCPPGEGSGVLVIPLLIVSALISVAGLWHFVAWVWR